LGWGGTPFTRPTEAEAIRVIHGALDLGINFIDTARGYATSEERIGKALAGRRDQVILATKGGGQDKVAVIAFIEQSLKHLRTDYIDLWQFHGIDAAEYEQLFTADGSLEGARVALKAGKIRHIDFSSHSLEVALKAVASRHFETVQFPFNSVNNQAAEKLVPLAREHDAGFIAMKPFACARLVRANLAIKYVLQFDNVVPDPGIERVAEIEEIVRVVNDKSWDVTSREQREMEDIRAELGTHFCRRCEYCMPCPQGVTIVRLMNQPILWKLWPHEWVISWKYVTDSIESARACIECDECETKCPYQLPIREMIVETVALYERMASTT
jgi:predicted aldo/keto reductase-like oxidoreductase